MSASIDVLVVGGGPAGAATAALLAADGLRVVVLERDAFPREKVCGEFVSAEGVAVLSRLGLLDTLLALGAARMDTCRLSAPSGRTVVAPLPDAGGAMPHLGVSRSRLDHVLLTHAASQGAEVQELCRVRAPRFTGNRVSGVTYRPRGTTRDLTLDATVVVAADGRRSVLGAVLHRALGDPAESGPASLFGLKVQLEGQARSLVRPLELHLFDGGYAGLGPIEGGRLNLCFLTTVRALRECGGSPDHVFTERLLANPAVAASVDGAKIAGRWHSIGPLRFGVREPAARGVLFAGDAAGTIDPFCGEGISHALLAAELVRPAARQAAASGGVTPAIETAYAASWRARFAPVTRRVRLLRLAFEHPRLASALLRLLDGPAHGLLPRLVAASRTG